MNDGNKKICRYYFAIDPDIRFHTSMLIGICGIMKEEDRISKEKKIQIRNSTAEFLIRNRPVRIQLKFESKMKQSGFLKS